MVIGKYKLRLENDEIELVSYKYRGNVLTKDMRCSKEVSKWQ